MSKDALLDCQDSGSGAARHVGFLENVLHMRRDGARARHQPGGDLAIAETTGHEGEDVDLAMCEPVRWLLVDECHHGFGLAQRSILPVDQHLQPDIGFDIAEELRGHQRGAQKRLHPFNERGMRPEQPEPGPTVQLLHSTGGTNDCRRRIRVGIVGHDAQREDLLRSCFAEQSPCQGEWYVCPPANSRTAFHDQHPDWALRARLSVDGIDGLVDDGLDRLASRRVRVTEDALSHLSAGRELNVAAFDRVVDKAPQCLDPPGPS